MWVMVASPLIVASDLRNMSSIQKKVLLNKDMIAIHQDRLGRGGNRIGYDDSCGELNACQVWMRPLFDGSLFVAL